MVRLYSFFDYRGSWEHAGAKAPADAQRIVDELGFERISLSRLPSMNSGIFRRAKSWLLWQVKKVSVFCHIAVRGILFIQYPHKCMQYLNGLIIALVVVKRVKVIILIHDLPGHGNISNPDEYKIPSECKWMRHAYLIVHNTAMLSVMVANGIKPDRLIDLEVFDYLADGNKNEKPLPQYSKAIIFAGNLECPKAAYVSCFREIRGVSWEVYGAPWNANLFAGPNVIYRGSKPAADLPAFLQSGFGLVWDGPSGESCVGGYGAYLKLNNPHKMSLFLVCGIPIVIWAQAAQAKFVLNHKVGIVVSALREIPDKIRAISESEYREMSENALKLAGKLKSGAFLRAALSEAMSR